MREHSQSVSKYFNRTDNYLHKRFGIRLRQDIIAEFMEEKRSMKNELLDIGCGDGSLSLPYVNQFDKLVLVDVSSKMLDLAKRNFGSVVGERDADSIEYINSDFLDLPSNRSFEVVFCIGVLAHVKNLDDFLKKVEELTSLNSIFIVQLSSWYHPLVLLNLILSKRGYGIQRLSKGMIVQKLKVHKFEEVFARKYLFPFPGMSLLSDSTLYCFQSSLRKMDCLSWLLSDHIVVFKKCA